MGEGFIIHCGLHDLPELIERIGRAALHRSRAKCRAKIRYGSLLLATKAAYHMEEKYPGHLYDVYRCSWCGGSHVGTSYGSPSRNW